MSEFGAVTRNLLAIAQEGIDEPDLARRVCAACVDGLDVDGAAITVLTASTSGATLWATDATARLLEDLQFTLNEGACMEAATTGRHVLVPDLRDSSETARWPMFAAAAVAQAGIGAVFALPLQWGTVNLGVLNLYRVEPGALDAAQHRDVVAAADTAALMFLGLRTDPTGGWLDHTIGHRAEIHQATGMVMIQLGARPSDALARLRATAFVQQRLLIDIARDVIDSRLIFTPDESPATGTDPP